MRSCTRRSVAERVREVCVEHSTMRNSRRRRRLETHAYNGMKAVEKLVLSAIRKPPLTQTEKDRLVREIQSRCEQVRVLAAEEGMEFPRYGVSEGLSQLALVTDTSQPAPTSRSGDVAKPPVRAVVNGVEHPVEIPGQPVSWVLAHGRYPFENYRQVTKRVDAVELTGADQAHEKIADPGPLQSEIEKGIFSV